MAIPLMADSDVARCIKNCLTCSRICLETLAHCLSNGKNGMASGKHISHMQLCADACQLSARLMIANSEFHHQACELTFEMSTACAEMCERFDDEEMLRCADICRRCAESCRANAGMTVRMGSHSDQDRSDVRYRSY